MKLKSKLIRERGQLCKKIDKLYDFINKKHNREELLCPISVLKKQANIMQEYIYILDLRIELLDIESEV